MKNCPKCNSPHTKPGAFCSRACANSRSFSKESRLKKSKANRVVWENLSVEEKQKRKEIAARGSLKAQGVHLQKLFESDFSTLSYQSMRKRVIIEQNGNCLHCGIHEWQGKLLPLELDHIDGDNNNNERSNLRILCPNCHSITPTWKGGNTFRTRELLQNAVKMVDALGVEPSREQ